MRIIAVANQKGGCGKTTVSVNLSASLAFLGKKVLLIDLDPQAHSTLGLGVKAEEVIRSVYDIFDAEEGSSGHIPDLRIPLSNFLHLLPSEIILSAIEQKLAGAPERENRLFRKLQEIQGEYDFVFIDCPPNLGLLTFNAFRAADELLIPIECSYFSLHGLTKISETVKLMTDALGHQITVRALLNDFDGRTRFSRRIQEELQRLFSRKLLRTVIHHSVRLKEAAALGKPISEYDRNSVVFQDFLSLSAELIEPEEEKTTMDHFAIPAVLEESRSVVSEKPLDDAQMTLFSIKAPGARCVQIAGDFNNWVPEELLKPIKADGVWRKLYRLGNGAYRYKFIVDGEWMCDPVNPHTEANPFGGADSIIETGAKTVESGV
ncbi:MAG TPA: AAA family ATPase [Candidatus Omnitrophota bacterium]|nr:AAA family ATPase [Candidatus Omnitrophota bacterium]